MYFVDVLNKIIHSLFNGTSEPIDHSMYCENVQIFDPPSAESFSPNQFPKQIM